MPSRLCIVPARGGSKRLPKKNITNLCGKPLIYHTLDVVSNLFDLVIVPTDSDEIIDIVNKHSSSKITTIVQPEHLATDSSKVIETVRWVFDSEACKSYDQIWLCLPTCPLRTEEDIILSKEFLTDSVDNVVSITDFEFPPNLGFNLNEDGFIFENDPSHPFQNDNTRSQDQPKVYRPNGAFYGSWAESFKIYRNFFGGNVKGVYMPRERSVDIDELIDLKLAELLLKK